MSLDGLVGKYDEEIDFSQLAKDDPAFANHFVNGRLDLQDSEAVKQLTLSILQRDFGISLTLPSDRLCPPVPVRYNYIIFCARLLSSSACPFESSPSNRINTGLDIGTGASCIYPLLGTSLFPAWTFYATDIDSHSLDYAHRNLQLNPKQSPRIILRRTTLDDQLVPLDALSPNLVLDFVMCNPPFYNDQEEMTASFEMKDISPAAICTGASNEMITPGGDAGFVTRMIEESLILRQRVKWYTSMLGKLSSLQVVVARLKLEKCNNYAVSTLKAGKRTKRWAIAWSWGDLRPTNDLSRGEDISSSLWPVSTLATVRVDDSVQNIMERLNVIMNHLDLEWRWLEDENKGIGRTKGNVWSRAARRQKEKQADVGDNLMFDMSETITSPQQIYKLGFTIHIIEKGLQIRWYQGLDPLLFESFCSMLRRAMNS